MLFRIRKIVLQRDEGPFRRWIDMLLFRIAGTHKTNEEFFNERMHPFVAASFYDLTVSIFLFTLIKKSRLAMASLLFM